MKRQIYLFIYLFILTFLQSCDKEQGSLNGGELNFIKEKNILSFRDKNVLLAYIKQENKQKNLVHQIYEDGFIPMRPSKEVDSYKFNELSRKAKSIQQNELLTQGKNNLTSRFIESHEDFISDDDFAAVLNPVGEVIVADKLYKYTEKGLFIVDSDQQEYLDKYLRTESSNGRTKYKYGLNPIDEVINVYVPNRAEIDSYKIQPLKVDDGGWYETGGYSDEYYGTGSSNTTSSMNPNNANTNNYTQCYNSSGSWVDNVFGKYYECTYVFSSRRKLVTSFGVEDYYLFFDVYAQTKFKKKDDFGFWWSTRDATTSYLKIQNAKLTFADRNIKFDFSIGQNDINAAWNEIKNVFNSSTQKKASYLSESFDRNGYHTIYVPETDELIYAANKDNYAFIPKEQDIKPIVNFDFKDFFNSNTNKVLVVTIMGQEAAITNTDILKAMYKAYVDFANSRKDVGVVVVSKPVDGAVDEAKVLSYSTAEELHQSFGNAIVNRTFNIPREIKLKELTFGFKNSGSGSKYGFSLDFSVKRVDKYDVSIEGGALYNGVWGGSKLRVIKE